MAKEYATGPRKCKKSLHKNLHEDISNTKKQTVSELPLNVKKNLE